MPKVEREASREIKLEAVEDPTQASKNLVSQRRGENFFGKSTTYIFRVPLGPKLVAKMLAKLFPALMLKASEANLRVTSLFEFNKLAAIVYKMSLFPQKSLEMIDDPIGFHRGATEKLSVSSPSKPKLSLGSNSPLFAQATKTDSKLQVLDVYVTVCILRCGSAKEHNLACMTSLVDEHLILQW
jgi:hypothetical protein